jgi:hypothetical protein
MLGYNKGSLDPPITVYYNGYSETSMQGYSKVSLDPSITVQ